LSFSNIAPLSFGGTISGSSPDNGTSWENILDLDDSDMADFDTDSSTSGTRDFGQQVYIQKVKGQAGSSNSGADFYIDVSNDNSNWTNIAHWTGDTYRGTPTSYYDVDGNWRYVRIRKSDFGWHDYRMLEIVGSV